MLTWPMHGMLYSSWNVLLCLQILFRWLQEFETQNFTLQFQLVVWCRTWKKCTYSKEHRGYILSNPNSSLGVVSSYNSGASHFVFKNFKYFWILQSRNGIFFSIYTSWIPQFIIYFILKKIYFILQNITESRRYSWIQ